MVSKRLLITTPETVKTNEKRYNPWPSLYRLGGMAALLVVLAGVLDMAIMFFPGTGTTPGEQNAVEWFRMFQDHPWLSLRNLGVLNMVTTSCTVLLFFALTAAHRRTNPVYTALALILMTMGATIYLANNTALPMLTLSSQYAAADNEPQKALLVAAGQALLAQEDLSAGTVIGFVIPEIAGMVMAFAMLRGRIFSPWAAWVGLLGEMLLFIFNIGAAFLPALYNAVLPVAPLGGLLSLTWFTVMALRLFKLAHVEPAFPSEAANNQVEA